jgi:two-component system OmpR family sensor kinase
VSLRARLVAVVLVLIAAGLLASDVATAASLRSYLLRRVDARLEAVAGFTVRALSLDDLTPQGPVLPPGGIGTPARPALDVQAARIDANGHVVRTLQGPFSSQTDAFTRLPKAELDRARAGQALEFNVSSSSGQWRARAERLAGSKDLAVVVSPLNDVEATLRRLYWIEGVATFVLLTLAGVAASRLVRVGLRPLVHIADTADAVASGDVDRRVDVEGGYEVARLGRALNSAFDARESSEQALRAFISDASHELRTPLTSIRGYTELLQAGALSDPPAQQRALERIGHEAARMGVLVDDLLALARLDERRPLQLADLDLSEIAADAVNDFRAVEPDRTIELIAPQPVPLLGDETGIRQVFANLLTNARLHTPAEAPVEVRVAASGSDARIDVIDGGAGLGAAGVDHAFDRFWRGLNGKPGHDEGSGLGLAIVAAVAAAHGGTAYVDRSSERLRGAHFVVMLPIQPRV